MRNRDINRLFQRPNCSFETVSANMMKIGLRCLVKKESYSILLVNEEESHLISGLERLTILSSCCQLRLIGTKNLKLVTERLRRSDIQSALGGLQSG